MMANRIVPLEIRGFSRGNSELLRPLPEKPEEPLPLSYVETVKEAINSFYMSDDSACSTPVQSHHVDMSANSSLNESLPSESSHAWSVTTGTMTGRSSVYSWGNDNEFDRKAAASVQRMFEEIDNMLYEGNDLDGGEPLLSECEEWCSRFPHLRIRGTQIFPSRDNGTEFIMLSDNDPRVYEHRPKTAVVDMESEDIAGYMVDFQGLSIQGNSLKLVVPAEMIAEIDLQEEVFAEDGCVEEYLAYDSSASSEDFKKNGSKSRYHMGYPPVTPNALATDTILSQVFDQLWGEIILWLRSLLNLYSKSILRGSLSERQFIPDLEKENDAIDLRPMSREVFPHTYQVRLRSGIQPSDVNGLNDLITIRSLPLKQRSTVYESRDGTPVCQARPGSSTVVMSRHSLVKSITWKNTDNHMNSRMSSARTIKRNPSLRLQPIDRSRTPGVQESSVIGEGVRGTKLVPSNDRLPSPVSPQPWGARNGTLPPIDKSEFLESSIRPRGISAKGKVHFSLRAASAATDDSRKTFKERGSSFVDSRPNTTHSFRQPETLVTSTRRLSTPIGTVSGSGSQLRPAGSFGYSGQSMVDGITGVSMPISNYHPSTEHGVHAHQQLYYHVEESSLLEESDEFEDTLPLGHYQSNATLSRRGRQYNSIR